MIVLGLTGSIGMGKSTTAAMFRDLGIPVHDADATVHALYAGKAAPVIEQLFPGTTQYGKVNRALLAQQVIGDDAAMKRLEAAIHPLVRAQEVEFLQKARRNNARLVVLDIPLLFETGGEKRVDGVIVVSANPQEQEKRVLSRPGMTSGKFSAILARQVADAEKRQRADFLVLTDDGLEAARSQAIAIVAQVTSGKWQPKKP